MVVDFFKGILIGIANVIPGVSGGTIAVVLGIFDQLIDAINNFYKKDFKRHLKFIFPIALGAVCGIVAFSSLIEYCLNKYSFQTSMFFVGLVVGSIPLILKNIKQGGSVGFKQTVLPVAISFITVVMLSLLGNREADMSQEIIISASSTLFLFFGGMLASASMVVPGVSGSFVMVLLGIYPTVIHAISAIKDYLANPTNFSLLLNISYILVPLGIGTLLGIVLVSKLISTLLNKVYSLTYSVILGLIFGSIFGIFNEPITYQSGISTTSIVIGAIMLFVGSVIAVKLG